MYLNQFLMLAAVIFCIGVYGVLARRNAIMAGFAATLKPEDMKSIAEYYAAQRPELQTLPRRVSILSKK